VIDEDFVQFEYDGWQRVADLYEATWAGLTRQFIPTLLDAAWVGPGVRVLDVACGPGHVMEGAVRRGAIASGVDFAPAMVALAQARNPLQDVRIGDAHALPFADDSFDVVLINFGMLHFSDPERALAEAARVLNRDGRLAFTVWAGPDESVGAHLTESILERHADMSVPVPRGPDRYGVAADARETLARCGFRTDTVEEQRVMAEWLVPSPDFVFAVERYAGVRTSRILAFQNPCALEEIEAALCEAVRRFATPRGYAIPFTAIVVSAERGSAAVTEFAGVHSISRIRASAKAGGRG
jgi:ubiquinone/menaquinone biosynthesis C-methylase UbiE